MVELIVSVGITAILMVGISAFFSNTFRNMFVARDTVSNTQGQFVVNSILHQKFLSAKRLRTILSQERAILQNDTSNGDLPFTFATDEDDRIVFKDFFVFNGRYDNDSSQGSGLDNPGGITLLNGDYYVTAPLENAVYRCEGIDFSTPCTDLDLGDGYDMPMDITSDGANNLYFTDAGNNRIVQINDPTGAKIASLVPTNGEDDFNFPTGLEFYSSGNDYLFISDTYNHLVKRVSLNTGLTETVVGDGEDEDCDNTAIFCKLDFPTGLMVQDDVDNPGQDALYIADTGNGRMLKMSDPPSSELEDVEFTIDVGGSTQISGITFTFPAGSDINNFADGSPNDMHAGKFAALSSTEIDFSLTVNLADSLMDCAGDGCTPTFRRFSVDEEDGIIEVDDTVEIEGLAGTFTITDKNDVGNEWEYLFTPTNTTTEPSFGADITITNSFSDDYLFYLDLSNTTLPSGFQEVTVEAFDENPTSLTTSSSYLRVSDGVLGTEEDVISVYEDQNIDYLTGLGWTGGAPTPPTSIDEPLYTPSFPEYDYISDFEVDNFDFDTSNGGDILMLTFDALTSGDVGAGTAVWETYTLNANLKE